MNISRFLLCKHLAQSVCLPKPNFFNEVKHYRTPLFWRHRDLTPLTQGLRLVEDEYDELNKILEENKFNEEDELTEKDEQSNYETDNELIAVLQECEEDENDTIGNVTEEPCESWEVINDRVTEKIQIWTNLLKSQEQFKDT
ncbi:hypothetical protein F8M41_025479 [Gigaspora margarita]|uniref:Uncharacterized protein n=1 Tax=Gigaspora margarita TaxID=4874 RepID=A0A8H4AB08_GIGMA|nr:hypothetical protein F8M41_025479 [Gigaspora margarita]